jgi:hypothetical protein
MGAWQGHTISKLCFNPTISYLDTGESTDVSQQLFVDLLEWAHLELGANFGPSSIHRWAFVSDIIFQTDFPLLQGQDPVLMSVADRVAQAVHVNLREKLDFQPSKFYLGHDPNKRGSEIAPFSIQHRINTLYEDNIFLGEAPVPTSLHLELLEEIEAEFRKNYEGR